MMKFKKGAIPEEPDKGVDFSNEKSIVVPDQAMSLQTILEKFTRGEELAIGMDSEFGDDNLDNPLNVDLEKLATADLTEKAEFVEELRKVQNDWRSVEKAEAEKAEAERAAAVKAADEKRIRAAARKLAKENSKKSA